MQEEGFSLNGGSTSRVTMKYNNAECYHRVRYRMYTRDKLIDTLGLAIAVTSITSNQVKDRRHLTPMPPHLGVEMHPGSP